MISWQYPWFFFLLPLPLVWRLIIPATKKVSQALKVPFVQAITQTPKQNRFTARFNPKIIIAYVVWGLFLIGSANPLWLGEPIQLDRSGRDLMLAIDLSQSMELPDMQLNGEEVNRLTALKAVAGDFIAKRRGDRLGVILFGSRAYLQTPLTFDWQTVQYMLDDASIGLAGPRTALGDAIGLAVKYLKDLPESNRVLVLLTDGANNSGHIMPLAAAKIAKQYGIKIYTIGLGSDQLSIRGFFGQEIINPSEDLDESVLKDIAKMTHGHYFRAKDSNGLAHIYDLISSLEPLGHDNITMRPQTALYPLPLGIALLISSLVVLRHWRWPFKRSNLLRGEIV